MHECSSLCLVYGWAFWWELSCSRGFWSLNVRCLSGPHSKTPPPRSRATSWDHRTTKAEKKNSKHTCEYKRNMNYDDEYQTHSAKDLTLAMETGTLSCRIQTPGLLLGLVMEFPPLFLLSPRFSLFPTLGYYPALGFLFFPPLAVIQP